PAALTVTALVMVVLPICRELLLVSVPPTVSALPPAPLASTWTNPVLPSPTVVTSVAPSASAKVPALLASLLSVALLVPTSALAPSGDRWAAAPLAVMGPLSFCSSASPDKKKLPVRPAGAAAPILSVAATVGAPVSRTVPVLASPPTLAVVAFVMLWLP